MQTVVALASKDHTTLFQRWSPSVFKSLDLALFCKSFLSAVYEIVTGPDHLQENIHRK